MSEENGKKKSVLVIGVLKFWKPNDNGGFGFVKVPGRRDIRVLGKGTGPVMAYEFPFIDKRCWEQAEIPEKGELVALLMFDDEETTAATWCGLDDWTSAIEEIARRQEYLIIREYKPEGSLGRGEEEIVWNGTEFDKVEKIPRFRNVDINGGWRSEGNNTARYWFAIPVGNGQEYDVCENPCAVS